MDHKSFLASLPKATRDHLIGLSNGPGLRHLAGHFGAIAVSALLISLQAPLWPLLMGVQGILLVFLFTLLHETSHHTPFASRWINTAVGHLCGFILILPASWFRYFHFAHHRFTQIPGKDPELESTKPDTWPSYIWHITGLPVWRAHIAALISNARGRCDAAYVPQARRAQVKREARLYIAGYIALAFVSLVAGSTLLIWIWLLPIILGQPFLRLYLLAEHGRCAFVANMLENTRTTYTNRVVRWLAWNMPYHAEHHSMPTVPFHKLPELNTLMAEYLKVTDPGYRAFHTHFQASLK